MNILNILKELKATKGTNAKLDLLAKHNSDIIKNIFIYAHDPKITFGVKQIPITSTIGDKPFNWLEISELLDNLYNRALTGNKALESIKNYLESHNIESNEIFKLILNKSTDTGISIAGINKVFDNIIKEHPCMLCSPINDKTIKKIKFPALVQTKADGTRCNIIINNGVMNFYSRNGKLINLTKSDGTTPFNDLLNFVDNVMIDGELVAVSNGADEQRTVGNGLVSKAIDSTISDDEIDKMYFYAWDMIDIMDFYNEFSPVKYVDRWSSLCSILIKNNPKNIGLIDAITVNNIDESTNIFRDNLSKGLEGIIIKNLDGVWENKRTKSQIKMKDVLECDLKVVGLVEGEGKYKGKLGALLCEDLHGKVKVSVGSGFSDNDREMLWNDDNVVDKIVSVKYNAVIKNKTSEYNSLFLPVFVEIRHDKDIADDLSNEYMYNLKDNK